MGDGWSESEEAELRRLIDAGSSGPEIARVLCKSRGAVSGKIHREGLRLQSAGKPGPRPRPARRERRDKPAAPVGRPLRAPVRPPRLNFAGRPGRTRRAATDAPPAPAVLNVPFLEQKPGQCKWPTEYMHVCGLAAEPGIRRPYCPYHNYVSLYGSPQE